MVNLFAHTALGIAPEFLSINLESDNSVTIIVRSKSPNGSDTGQTAQVSLASDQFHYLAQRLYSFACTGQA